MEKIVGLSRAIKQEWLDKTVELVLNGDDESTIKEMLNEYLSFEIGSPTNLRKTREILMNVWVKSAVAVPHIHKEAIHAYRNERSDKVALCWSMLLLTYPIFSDVCCIIGKINEIQDTFTTAWLKEKLNDIWGERSTLFHSTDKLLQTLKHLKVIENTKVGVYQIKQRTVTDEATIRVLLMSLLALKKKAYYEISELSRISLFFPFVYDVSHEWLHNSPEFSLDSFGGKMVLSAINEK